MSMAFAPQTESLLTYNPDFLFVGGQYPSYRLKCGLVVGWHCSPTAEQHTGKIKADARIMKYSSENGECCQCGYWCIYITFGSTGVCVGGAPMEK